MKTSLKSFQITVTLAILAATSSGAAAQGTPQAVAQTLLEADRAFARAGSHTDMLSALTPMLADGVMMPTPAGSFAIGKPAVLEALRASPDAATSRITWTPIRVGISRDGAHGFTFGYMTQVKADSSRVPLKYMAYWVRDGNEWRVLAYKRGRSAALATDTTPMPSALPAKLVGVVRDTKTLTSLRHDVMHAEQSFSDESQKIGLGYAFAKFGSSDAVNMGGPGLATYIVGADAIAKAVGGADMKASPVTWGADTAFVASSGDLGITFGIIRRNNAPAGAPAASGSPFFTIWRKADSRSPWRYVAE